VWRIAYRSHHEEDFYNIFFLRRRRGVMEELFMVRLEFFIENVDVDANIVIIFVVWKEKF